MNNIIFKSINGFEDYEISNDGIVRNKLNGNIVNHNNVNGYKLIHLKNNNKWYQKYLHRIIAENYIDNPFDYKCIDHIDGNRSNNEITNLRWCNNR
jgi:hypothetical protein